eukprot:1161917-Pelagomonas_calceolata.AAC.7
MVPAGKELHLCQEVLSATAGSIDFLRPALVTAGGRAAVLDAVVPHHMQSRVPVMVYQSLNKCVWMGYLSALDRPKRLPMHFGTAKALGPINKCPARSGVFIDTHRLVLAARRVQLRCSLDSPTSREKGKLKQVAEGKAVKTSLTGVRCDDRETALWH